MNVCYLFQTYWISCYQVECLHIPIMPALLISDPKFFTNQTTFPKEKVRYQHLSDRGPCLVSLSVVSWDLFYGLCLFCPEQIVQPHHCPISEKCKDAPDEQQFIHWIGSLQKTSMFPASQRKPYWCPGDHVDIHSPCCCHKSCRSPGSMPLL